MSASYRKLRDLAGKAYTDNAVHNELLLTIFVERLANSVIRWELRRAKLTAVEDAVSLTIEVQSFSNLHGQRPDTSAASVNNLTGSSMYQSNLFSDLNFTVKGGEVERAVVERSGPPQRGCSGERPSSSRSQPSESTNHTNQGQCRNWNQNRRNCTKSQGNTPNRSQSHDANNRVSSNNSGSNSAKNANVATAKIMTPNIVKAVSNFGAFGHSRRVCRSRSQNKN